MSLAGKTRENWVKNTYEQYFLFYFLLSGEVDARLLSLFLVFDWVTIFTFNHSFTDLAIISGLLSKFLGIPTWKLDCNISNYFASLSCFFIFQYFWRPRGGCIRGKCHFCHAVDHQLLFSHCRCQWHDKVWNKLDY